MCVDSAGNGSIKYQSEKWRRVRKGVSCLERGGSAIHGKKSSSEAVTLVPVTLFPTATPPRLAQRKCSRNVRTVSETPLAIYLPIL